MQITALTMNQSHNLSHGYSMITIFRQQTKNYRDFISELLLLFISGMSPSVSVLGCHEDVMMMKTLPTNCSPW